MLAVRTLLPETQLPTAPAPVAPTITPTAAPAYQPPISYPIVSAPMIAPPPSEQFRGEGGTAFGAVPTLYNRPWVATFVDKELLYPYGPRDGDPDGLVAGPQILPPRPGEEATMPVVEGQQPAKEEIPPTRESVQRPGPISGTVAGFDLSRVPLWAWLTVAVFIGVKVLR